MKDLFDEEEESDHGDQFSEDFYEEFEENNSKLHTQGQHHEEKRYKSMKEEISEYIKTGNPSIQLGPLLDIFHKDILSRLLLEKEIGLNQLSQNFLIKLLNNYENFDLDTKFQLLNLLKTIKFQRSLVPFHIYSRIEEHILILVNMVLDELKKNVGKFNNITQIIKIMSDLDKKITEVFTILENWMNAVTDPEIKEIRWSELYYFHSVLRAPPLRLQIRYNLNFKMSFFEIIQKKFFILDSKNNFDEVCFSFFVLMNFSIQFRFYSRNLKVLLDGFDMIIGLNSTCSMKSCFFIIRCLALMNKTYKENEILEKFFKDAPKWQLQDYPVYLLLKFEYLMKILIQKKPYSEKIIKMVSILEKEILLRLKFISKKTMTPILLKYCEIYPMDESNQIYYQIFFIKLLYTDINRRNHQTFIAFMKNLCYFGQDFRPLLKNCAAFLKEEVDSIPSFQKIVILKLLANSNPNQEFKELISLYLNSLQRKVLEIKSAKFILSLLREAFFDSSLDPDPIGKLVREIILKRVNAIWDILSGKSNFLICVTKHDRSNEPYVAYFLHSKLNSFASPNIFFKYVSDFSLIENPSLNQIKYLRIVLEKTNIETIKKCRDFLFQILREMNASTVWDEKTGHQDQNIAEIANLLNVKEIIIDEYPDYLWKKFKAYLNFLCFNDLLQTKIIIEFLFKKFQNSVEKWIHKDKEPIIDMKTHVNDFKDICSSANIIHTCMISSHLVDEEFNLKYIEILKSLYDPFLKFVKQEPNYFISSNEGLTHIFHNILTVTILMRHFNIGNAENINELFTYLINDVSFSYFFVIIFKKMQMFFFIHQNNSFLYMVFENFFKLCEIDANGWAQLNPEIKELLKKALQVIIFNKNLMFLSKKKVNLEIHPIIWKKTVYAIIYFNKQAKFAKKTCFPLLEKYEDEILKLFNIFWTRKKYIGMLALKAFFTFFKLFPPNKNFKSKIENILIEKSGLFPAEKMLASFQIFFSDLMFLEGKLLGFLASKQNIFFKENKFWCETVPFILDLFEPEEYQNLNLEKDSNMFFFKLYENLDKIQKINHSEKVIFFCFFANDQFL